MPSPTCARACATVQAERTEASRLLVSHDQTADALVPLAVRRAVINSQSGMLIKAASRHYKRNNMTTNQFDTSNKYMYCISF